MRRRRWKSDNRKKRGPKRLIFITIVIFTFLSFESFILIEKSLKTPLMNVAKIRVKQIATEAINEAISERISNGTNYDKLVDMKMDNRGKISGFMLNYAENMKIASETKDVVQTILQKLNKMPEHIPLGQVMDSAILGSFGPDIPIKLTPAGAVKVELSTRQKDAGINTLLVEVYIHITAEVAIIIPFDTEPEVVETEVPIAYMGFLGDVPVYYVDSKGHPIGDSEPLPPSVSIPDLSKTGDDSSADASAEQSQKASGK